MIHASASCFIVQAGGLRGFLFGLANAGKSIAARIAMMAMTTSSSIRVKPWTRPAI